MQQTSYPLHTFARFCRELKFSSRDISAEEIGRSPRQLADYELGKYPIPEDVLVDMAIAYRSPKLLEVKCQHCRIKSVRKELCNAIFCTEG